MATSHPGQISKIVTIMMLIDPKSILDLGTGHGMYGVLARQYLDEDHYLKNNRSNLQLEGVEVFKDYIGALHAQVYNKMHHENILNTQAYLHRQFELTLLIDVIEHLTLTEGRKLVQTLLEHSKFVLISTPKYVGKQEANANEFEAHKSQWSRKDFNELGYTVYWPDRISHILLLSKDQAAVKQLSDKKNKYLWREFVASNDLINKVYRKFHWSKKFGIDNKS